MSEIDLPLDSEIFIETEIHIDKTRGLPWLRTTLNAWTDERMMIANARIKLFRLLYKLNRLQELEART